MAVTALPDWLGVLLFGVRYIESTAAAVSASSTLNFTGPLAATFNPATGAIDVTAPGVGAGVVPDTPSTIVQRGTSGEGLFAWTAPASANVAAAGAMRLAAGNQIAVAAKGQSHATVQLIGLAGAGPANILALGDGVEVTQIDLQSASLIDATAVTGPALTIDATSGAATVPTTGWVRIHADTRVQIVVGSRVIFVADSIGAGFNGLTAGVAAPTRIGQLTDSTTGTPGGTIADGGAVYSQATTNNNNASLLQRINALELALHNVGITL
jgi:hypothetical protein